MSDTSALPDAPQQQKTHADILAARAERNRREAEEDAAREAEDKKQDEAEDKAAAEAEAKAADETQPAPANEAHITTPQKPVTVPDVHPVVPGSDIGPVDLAQHASIEAAADAALRGDRGQPPAAGAGVTNPLPAMGRDPGNPDATATVPTPEQEPDDHAKAEADAAEKAEQAKKDRAERGVTGAQNGDPAGIAFGPRIAAATFEHRNQGHDDTMQLLDDMLAAIQRLEAKLAEGPKPFAQGYVATAGGQ